MHMIETSVTSVTKTVENAVSHTNQVLEPIRQSVFKRFPTIFALLVTVGASATFFGIERMIVSIPWLDTRPWLILFSGVFLLVLTGRLYKKLG